MIIDVHGHLSPPLQLWAFKARLQSNSGHHGQKPLVVSDEDLVVAFNAPRMGSLGHRDSLGRNGIDLQLISPPQTSTMNSEQPATIVHWFTEATNDLIHRTVGLFPDHLRGICGLPQPAGHPIEASLAELDRCMERGFVGCMINPDPYENTGPQAPPLGDEYWYPLYEALCRYDVPGYVHAGASRTERTPYNVHSSNEETIALFSLVSSDVFTDFPDLKLIFAHGGGGFPYQFGRFEPWFARVHPGRDPLAAIRSVYFDTMLFAPRSLRLLIEMVGPDRCVYGSESPGVGSIPNPATGRNYDDMVPVIEGFEWISSEEKELIFEDNARKLFKL